jgi:hypothetical protein
VSTWWASYGTSKALLVEIANPLSAKKKKEMTRMRVFHTYRLIDFHFEPGTSLWMYLYDEEL